MDASIQTEDTGDHVPDNIPSMALDVSHGADSSIQGTDSLNNSETPVDSLRQKTESLLLDHFRSELGSLKDVFGELERALLDGRLPLDNIETHR